MIQLTIRNATIANTRQKVTREYNMTNSPWFSDIMQRLYFSYDHLHLSEFLYICKTGDIDFDFMLHQVHTHVLTAWAHDTHIAHTVILTHVCFCAAALVV